VTSPAEPDLQAGAIEVEDQTDRDTGRLRSLFAGSRDLARIVYRDPDHVSERLTLTFVDRAGESSRDWAQSVLADDPAGASSIAAELCRRSAQISRVDGAIAGTPFLIALVPGYLGHLWQEGVLVLRLAALYGHDPRAMQTAAESLVLRGVHPDVEAARTALDKARASPMPDRPQERRPLRHWVRSVRMLGVFGGFMSAPEDGDKPAGFARLRVLAGLLFAAMIWAVTWIFPVTFMLAMSWGCESHARTLGRRATGYYAGDTQAAVERDSEEHGRRRLLRSIGLILSFAVPIAFVAYADHIRNTTGINAWGAAGAVVALSLVIAMAVVARRR
jgi:hypothetical protein